MAFQTPGRVTFHTYNLDGGVLSAFVVLTSHCSSLYHLLCTVTETLHILYYSS